VGFTVKELRISVQKQGVAVEIESELDSHPHWQLVLRIIASPQLVRSSRLKAFLLYVTRCALLGRSDEITEQQIGVHVFGRPADYHAGDDNIVRSQARFLRTKLSEYFDSPTGADEPVVLSIPKGSYVPLFEPAQEKSVAASSPEIAAPAPPRRRKLWVPAVTALAFLTLSGVWLGRGRMAGPDTSIWPRLFDGRQTTTIVASDYIFSMVQEAAGRSLTLDEYLGADYFERVAKLNAESGLDRMYPDIAHRHYTGFENVTSVARLMGLKQAQATHTQVRFARDLTMRDVASGNLILVGSKQSNPWVLLFENKLNFRFDFESASHRVFIVNASPQKGEDREYRPSALDATSRIIYGGIAFVPNIHRDGNVLILQGTSMGATEVALDVLANPALFQDLIRRVGRPFREGQTPYFEALIRTQTINGVAGEWSIAGFRVIQ
jgi:hypothetical protein